MKLRDYQERISTEAAAKLKQYGMCYLAMECRTGKTLTALATAIRYGASSVLFLTKLKAIGSIHDDSARLSPGYTLEVTNYESCHKCAGRYDLIILDEAHCLGAYPKPSKRTEHVKRLCKGLPVLYLSGTPSPESYSQLFHQFWVSEFSPFAEYPNFYKWAKAGYVDVREKRVNGYRINDYSHADKAMIDEAAGHLFMTYTQEEAGFFTDIEEYALECPMLTGTAQIMRILKRNKVYYFADAPVLGDTPAKLMGKLHQLSGGTVITEDGAHRILDRSKALYLRNRFAGQKIAVFYVYQSELDLLRSVFPQWTDSPEEFQQSGDLVFISQIRRAREGVRLDTADAIIFYNLEFSYLSYEQGRNRIMSKERATPAKVYFLISDCGIDRDILEAVRNKQDFTASYYRRKYGKV